MGAHFMSSGLLEQVTSADVPRGITVAEWTAGRHLECEKIRLGVHPVTKSFDPSLRWGQMRRNLM